MNYPEIFNRCVKVVLRNEGGHGNNPADPGGETNFGIADAADGKKDGLIDIDRDGTGDVKVKDLTVDQAKEIYYKKYWIPMKLDGLKDENLVLHVFDMGVNAGPGRSIKILQGIIGATVDGDCGPQTCRKANLFKGDLVNEFKQERKKFYFACVHRDNEKQVFLAGWLNRIDNTKLL
jgi:lysozyme family protein